MERAKVLVEKEMSLDDIRKELLKNKETFLNDNLRPEYIIHGWFKPKLRELFGKNILCELETIKKHSWITAFCIKHNIIRQESPYFFWYHLFFPTIQERKNNMTVYTIDSSAVYRINIAFNEGSIKIRLKYNYKKILERISYRVVKFSDTEEGESSDEL